MLGMERKEPSLIVRIQSSKKRKRNGLSQSEKTFFDAIRRNEKHLAQHTISNWKILSNFQFPLPLHFIFASPMADGNGYKWYDDNGFSWTVLAISFQKKKSENVKMPTNNTITHRQRAQSAKRVWKTWKIVPNKSGPLKLNSSLADGNRSLVCTFFFLFSVFILSCLVFEKPNGNGTLRAW